MSKVSLEQVIEEAKSLTPEEQRQLREALDEEKRSIEQAERDRLASSIRGKYVDVLSSSEDFAARKAEEIALEERP
jgi:hypothetical protein